MTLTTEPHRERATSAPAAVIEEITRARRDLARVVDEQMAVIEQAIAARQALDDWVTNELAATGKADIVDGWLETVDETAGNDGLEYEAAVLVDRLRLVLDPEGAHDFEGVIIRRLRVGPREGRPTPLATDADLEAEFQERDRATMLLLLGHAALREHRAKQGPTS